MQTNVICRQNKQQRLNTMIGNCIELTNLLTDYTYDNTVLKTAASTVAEYTVECQSDNLSNDTFITSLQAIKETIKSEPRDAELDTLMFAIDNLILKASE